MKKTILILTLLFALAATPVLATPGNGKGKDHANDNAKMNRQVQGIEISPTDEPEEENDEEEQCGPDEEYKNHGAYVSCVAKTHPGGKKVSEAARSDIGKKQVDDDDDDITPSPSISPSVSPTASPSVSPTDEPTPTGSPSGDTTENEENNALNQQIQSIIQALTNLIESLKNLL